MKQERRQLGLLLLLILLAMNVSVSPVSAHVDYVLTPLEREAALQGSALGAEIGTLAPAFFLLFAALAVAQFSGLVMQNRQLVRRIVVLFESWSRFALPALRIASGAFLLISGLTGTYFAPQLGNPLGSASPVTVAEIASGIMLLVGAFTRIGALLLLSVYLYTFVQFGVFGLDHLYLLGVGTFFLVSGSGKFAMDGALKTRLQVPKLLKNLPVHTILRVLLGLNLIWLGLTEKILQPGLTAAAITKFGVPYYPELGVFVFLFGIFEIYLGFHFVLGLFVRVTSLIYLGLLISAIGLFGETVNHLALFGLTAFLLLVGAREYYTRVGLQRIGTQEL